MVLKRSATNTPATPILFAALEKKRKQHTIPVPLAERSRPILLSELQGQGAISGDLASLIEYSPEFFIGVDVGTNSVRAGLFSFSGQLLQMHQEPIEILSPQSEYFQQFSQQIWEQVCRCVHAVTSKMNQEFQVEQVKGIGFDATCSLVLLDASRNPVELEGKGNVILWMDHRAVKQAEKLSNSNHPALERFGGKVSSEMSLAKICWLYENRKDIYDRVDSFLELPDFLVSQCTKDKKLRGINSLVCKWGYDPVSKSWPKDLWSTIIHDEGLYNKILMQL